MRRVEIIILDSGLLGRALWLLNHTWLISSFFLACLLIPLITYIGLLLHSSDPFVVWDRMSRLVAVTIWVGAGIAIMLAISLAGLFLLPIANQRTNLYFINRAMRSKFRGSEKWGPVTLTTLIASVVIVCTFLAAFITIFTWNERNQHGVTALTGMVFGLVLLMTAFQYFQPTLRRWFYRRRFDANEQNGDFILLLRSFKGDLLHTRSRPFYQTDSIEGMVTDMLERFTTVIAVSDPRDATQPVGAQRIALQATEWQPRARELLDRAAGIVVVLDKSPGLGWELDRICEEGRLSKAVFVVWAPEPRWLSGPWVELLERIGGCGSPGALDGPKDKTALAVTCSDERMRIVVGAALTPLNCGLAVSTLIWLSMSGR